MRLPYAVPLYVLVTLVVSGCAAPAPTIRSNQDPGTNFAQYDNFAFIPELEQEDYGYQSFLVQYLKEAITREMNARGYAYRPRAAVTTVIVAVTTVAGAAMKHG